MKRLAPLVLVAFAASAGIAYAATLVLSPGKIQAVRITASPPAPSTSAVSPTNVRLVSSATTGRLTQGDSIEITFNGRLNPNSVCTFWSNTTGTTGQSTSNGGDGNALIATAKNVGTADTATMTGGACTLGLFELLADYVSADTNFQDNSSNTAVTYATTGITSSTLTLTFGKVSGTDSTRVDVPTSRPAYTAPLGMKDSAGLQVSRTRIVAANLSGF